MPLPREKAWFASKKYGYGWGLPLRWQGWVAMGIYLAIMLVGATQVAKTNLPLYLSIAFGISILLCLICWWKGEPAKWRWGGREK